MNAKAKNAQPNDALALLVKDHDAVRELFAQYQGLGERAHASRQKLALRVCEELTVHATIEEEIFYPALRAAAKGNEDLVDEAIVEHATVKDMIAQIQAMKEGDDLFDAKVKVLSEQVEHHVGEEEKEIFQRARDSKLDLSELGRKLDERKRELEAQMD